MKECCGNCRWYGSENQAVSCCGFLEALLGEQGYNINSVLVESEYGWCKQWQKKED
jgi:hypothetical protein